MNEKNKNPIIEWKKIDNKECLFFTFKGILTKNDALYAIKEWKDLFGLKKDKQIILVWHCLEMNNYEPMARYVWQKAVKELKGQIDIIWLITNSTIIQAGAKIMTLFISFNIKTVKSEEEIILN